jgi:hypothetical protein
VKSATDNSSFASIQRFLRKSNASAMRTVGPRKPRL